MDAMAAIKQTFFQECEEQLAELETGLLMIQDGDEDPETVNAVFRAVHSIKGGAGAFSLEDLVHFAHAFETALDHVRAGRLKPSQEALNVMLRAADMLADLVRAARAGEAAEVERCRSIAVELQALDPGAETSVLGDGADDASFGFEPVQIDASLFDEPEPAAPAIQHNFNISFKPKPALYAKANETAIIFRELARLGETSVDCDTTGLPLLAELDPEGSYLSWRIELRTAQNTIAVREVFEFVESDCDLEIEGGPAAMCANEADIAALIQRMQSAVEADLAALSDSCAAPVSDKAAEIVQQRTDRSNTCRENARRSAADPGANKPDAPQATIRVDLDRVDRLINLVGELVITQATLTQRVTETGLARASGVAAALDQFEQLTREIQDSVMAIRAQPVKSVFQRMPRLVREVAAMTGKSVRLVTEGENTEVDKTVIERLADPLTHMIRNAIDHGLETPEVRIAAGKSEEGVLRLSALHRSGRIVIEVADDGAGIDRVRVKAIAAGKGLIPADAQLADEEIDNLIFLPGFSTAAMVSDISGRGVGMDVVRRSIQALGGRILINSRPGQGSTFTMSLPLTLAVLDGMVVMVAGQTLVVPLTAIVETLQPKIADVHGFGGAARVIAVRDQFTPLIDVGRELRYRGAAAEPSEGVALHVESEGGVRSALLVDSILGQRQVVIKSLEENYGHVSGIAAATILGDGRVALILDVDALVSNSRAEAAAFDALLSIAG